MYSRILKKISISKNLGLKTHFAGVKPLNIGSALARVELFTICICTWFDEINKIVKISIVSYSRCNEMLGLS